LGKFGFLEGERANADQAKNYPVAAMMQLKKIDIAGLKDAHAAA
jgi:hypothetical protein